MPLLICCGRHGQSKEGFKTCWKMPNKIVQKLPLGLFRYDNDFFNFKYEVKYGKLYWTLKLSYQKSVSIARPVQVWWFITNFTIYRILEYMIVIMQDWANCTMHFSSVLYVQKQRKQLFSNLLLPFEFFFLLIGLVTPHAIWACDVLAKENLGWIRYLKIAVWQKETCQDENCLKLGNAH